jgi:uncharacterized protein YndB with AHSA1/START domain
MSRDLTANRFATLTFDRHVAAPLATLYAAWTSPAARAIWASPAPSVTVEFLEADSRVGGREVSLCKVAGEPDIRVEAGWLDLVPEERTVGYEVVSREGEKLSAALATAEFAATATAAGSRSRSSFPRWRRTWRRATGRASTPGSPTWAAWRNGRW